MAGLPGKAAIVLFNLGGPDNLDAVEPFLKNLFSDPAILRVPGLVRWFLARIISRSRAPEAKKIYAELGGGSPIVPQTQAQADKLISVLSEKHPETEFKAEIVMRYWHPRADDVIDRLLAYKPDRIIALPLYPQFSTTTTASSLNEFRQLAKQKGLAAPIVGPCCYPIEQGFVSAYKDLIQSSLEEAQQFGTPRLLFSAHGLPEKIVQAGDPYQFQVEQSAKAIADALDPDALDWRVTYQSRVGPLKWIGPSTDDEIIATVSEGLVPVICPIAFVSEHSETLVELDIEYRELAMDKGAKGYVRVPTVGSNQAFIDGLAGLVSVALSANTNTAYSNEQFCSKSFKDCPRNKI